MATLKIPTPLRPYVNGQAELLYSATTVSGILDSLFNDFPAFKLHLCRDDGTLHSFIHIFVNGQDIRSLKGILTPIGPSDVLNLVPSIAGG